MVNHAHVTGHLQAPVSADCLCAIAAKSLCVVLRGEPHQPQMPFQRPILLCVFHADNVIASNRYFDGHRWGQRFGGSGDRCPQFGKAGIDVCNQARQIGCRNRVVVRQDRKSARQSGRPALAIFRSTYFSNSHASGI